MKLAIRTQPLAAVASTLRHRAMAPRFRHELHEHPGGTQVLVDVSTIIRADARTGIQRVVRAVLGQMDAAELPGVTVQPVFASRNHGFCRAVMTPGGRLANASRHRRGLQPVAVRPGDVFLGLDLTAQTLPAVERQLAQWRRGGVSINLVIYDLLPITHPELFSPQLVRNFHRWFGVVARQSDRCLCISEAVADRLSQQLSIYASAARPAITTFPLGADITASFPSRGLPGDFPAIRQWAHDRRAVLAVGTVEPRKGFALLLDAFEQIWRADPASSAALLIVGRAGWRTDALQERIRTHPEQGKRLLWLDRASDEALLHLYQLCAGLVSASREEGFGLPLLEAVAQGAPVLARDLPVFREVGGTLFDYFNDEEPEPLARRIVDWLGTARRPSAQEIARLPRWSDSAAAVLARLGLAGTKAEAPH